MPKIEWLQDPALGANRLVSFLGHSREAVMAPLVGAEAAGEFSAKRVFHELETLVAALEQDGSQQAPWVLLSALLSHQPCPSALSQRLAKVVEHLPWEAMSLDETARYTALVALSTRAWSIGGKALSQIMQKRIAQEARRLSKLPGDARDHARRSQAVLLAIQGLARHAPEEKSAGIFAEALVASIDEWPALVNTVPGASGQMLLLPDSQLVQVWQLILRLRHDAEPHRYPVLVSEEEEDSEDSDE